MTSSTISRQPKGIPVGGQFAATAHGEATVSLSPAAPAALNEDDILAAVAAHDGPGAVPGVRRRIAETTTEAGRELFLQRCDAMYNPDSPYVIDRSIYGPTPEHCDALAALGYESVNQVDREATKNFPGIGAVIDGGIGPERLAVLRKLSTHQHQWSAWEKSAYLNAPLEDLEQVITDQGMTRAEKYLATVDLMGVEANSARAREAIGMGIGDRGLIEADQHSLAVLADLRDALPESKRTAAHIVGLADRGITGPRLRTYGSKACETFTGDELEQALVAPKTIRSFLSSGVNPSLAEMKVLHDAGYTTSNDLKDASRALGTNDTAILAAARRHAPGARLALFAAATGHSLRREEPEAIARLEKLGITDPAQLQPWSAAVHVRANRNINRNQSVLAIHADVIAAGITPERLGAMTRAGIPVTEAPQHKDTQDLWAAGADRRAAWDKDQQVRIASRWITEPTPWAYTEDTYLDGATA